MISRQSISLSLASMLVAVACGGGGGGGGSNGGSPSGGAPTLGNMIAVTGDGRIVSFDAGAPETLRTSMTITGLQSGDSIVAIDVRPATGDLLGASAARLYRIDAESGVATLISTFPAALPAGSRMQVDPTSDHVSIVTSLGQSMAFDPNTGIQLAGGSDLHYATGDAAAGSPVQLGAMAFADDHAFASHTTLFGIDTMQGTLVRVGDVDGTPQSFESGEVHTVAPVTGSMSATVGFDITPDGGALMSTSAPGAPQSDLFALDLSDGSAHLLGTFGVGTIVRTMAWRGEVALRVFGITDQNTLVTFHPGAPGAMLSSVAVSGLVAGDHLVAIDQRVTDGLLYALGDGGHLYVLDPPSGAATELGPGFTTALTGTSFDLDFTPQFGAARVVDDADQNLRVNPLDGSVGSVDQTLAYGAGDPSFGADPSVVAAAFDRNEFGESGSTMFAIDSTAGTLVRIGSFGGAPNLPASGMLTTIGSLGVVVGSRCGLDIDADGTAFAALDLGPVSNLCTIDLTSGAVHDIGPIGGTARVIDIAVELPPAPTVYGVDDSNRLLSFRAGDPRLISSSFEITGLDAGESIQAIDFRPVTGELLGVSDMNRVFRINRFTTAATLLGPSFMPAPTGTRTSAEVDPSTDELRVVSDGNTNMRVSTTSGATIAVDPNLAYAAGDVNFGMDPGVVSIAHTQSFTGASSTALYGIDASLGVLVRQGAFAGPSNGQLRTVGSLGVALTGTVGFDVDSRGVALVSRPDGAHTLYRIDLATGTLSPLGAIGGGAPLRDIAILPR